MTPMIFVSIDADFNSELISTIIFKRSTVETNNRAKKYRICCQVSIGLLQLAAGLWIVRQIRFQRTLLGSKLCHRSASVRTSQREASSGTSASDGSFLDFACLFLRGNLTRWLKAFGIWVCGFDRGYCGSKYSRSVSGQVAADIFYGYVKTQCYSCAMREKIILSLSFHWIRARVSSFIFKKNRWLFH